MDEQATTKKQLLDELMELHRRVSELEAKVAEGKLREERLQYLVSSSPAVIYACRPHGDYGTTFMSDNVKSLLGYEPEEFTGDSSFWADRIHPEDAEKVFLDLSMLFQRGYHVHEYRFLRKDGTYRWMHDELKLVRDHKGNVIEILGFWIDITDRNQVDEVFREVRDALEQRVEERTAELNSMNEKLLLEIKERQRAEKSLRESEARYRLVVENANELIGVVQDGRFVFSNPRGLELSGYSEEEVTSRPFLGFVHPDDRQTAFKLYQEAMEGEGARKAYVFRVTDRWGKARWGHVSAVRIEWDGRPAALVFGIEITELKQAEKALRESEERYRSLFEGSRDAIYLTARDGRLDEANQAFLDLFGFSREEARDMNILKVYLEPADRPRFQERIERHGSLKDYEVKFHKKDGTEIDCLLTFTLRLDKDGNILGYQGIARDITERRRAEETLRESEERLELALQGADLGLWDLDLKSGRAVLNERAAEMAGYELHELDPTMSKFENLCHPEDKDRVLLALSAHANRESPVLDEEYRLRTKSGEWKWIQARGRVVERDEHGNAVRMAGTFLDVTERKKSEIALRRLATAVDQAEEAIAITDPAGTIQYVNPAFEKITGYSRDEALGKNPRILKSGEQDQEFYRNLWNTITQGKVWRGRFVNRRKDGAFYREDATISPVRDRSGGIVNFVAVKRDVTQELSLQDQLLHAQKMEAIGTLAGGLAHDFNNLLQVVLGYSEWLLAEKTEEDPDYADVTNIFQAAKSGADLVRRLLTFSRRVEPQTIPLNLNQRIQQMKSILRRTIPRMIKIAFDLSWAIPTVKVDPTQIEQVLVNLAVNARDAMPEGGKLIIKTENVRLDEAFCKTCAGLKPGQYAALIVADTGHGMDKETLEHIFEPFYTTKELGHGTGLGLAIVYGIIKQHGGHITCVSHPGRGTTFSIYLPAVEAEQARDVEHSSGEMPAFGTETVLLVDDEDLVRDLGERIFTRRGYTVLTASNGREALDLYKREKDRIHLVILDLIMPEMGGKQCLEAILKINPKAKVLVASGYSGDLPTRESLEMGAKGFVGKPFREKKLLRVVRRALGKDQ